MGRIKGKVVVFGLDGATFDLILPWVEAGKLPAFHWMLKNGSYGLLDSAPNMRSAASWTSFYTGKNPGKHGIYEFYDFIPENYNIRFINGGNCREPSLWRLLGEQGLQSIVINVPMTYPAEKINGILLAGLDAPGSHKEGFCHPAEVLTDLEERFGSYVLEPGLTGFLMANRLDEAKHALFEEIEQKRKIMFYLLKNSAWDMLTVVYRSLDAAQHCFWKYMDTGHPQHDPNMRSRYGSIIFQVYQKLDEILSELIDCLHPEDTLMVMSDHGFGRKHPASNQLNAWLAGKGYLAYRSKNRWVDISYGSSRILGNAYGFLGAMLSRRQKEFLSRHFSTLRNRVQSQLCFTGIDWAKTSAYSDSLFANIRINLKNREGNGIVGPGAEYWKLVDDIRNDLLNCRDAKTSERLISQVFHKNDLYRGPCLKKAPDLTIRWREDIDISGIQIEGKFPPAPGSQPAFQPSIPAEDASVISGDHRRFGVFLAVGPNIKKAQRVEGARIIDLAPTILYLLDSPISEGMDGKMLSIIFHEPALIKNPFRIERHMLDDQAEENIPEYSENEKEAIADRLRQLGYLE